MASEETYNDTISEKVITKKELKKIMFRSYLLQSSFNYERMQAGGWTYSLIPGLKKIHRDKEDLALSLENHLQFMNTNPTIGDVHAWCDYCNGRVKRITKIHSSD